MGRLSLPSHSYTLAAKTAGAQRLLNCYAEQAPPEGKAPIYLSRNPGIKSAVAPTAGTGRGVFTFQNKLYSVVGNTLYRVESNHLATSLGTIAGTSQCTFASNSYQMVICDPNNSYVFDGLLTRITDADFNNGTMCIGIDSYIVYLSPDGKLFCSDLADAKAYDALNFATPEGSPDDARGLIADHRQIIIGSTDSVEIYENFGGSGFPFLRASNGFLELGCAAGFSFAKADNSVYWLASDLTVRRLDGLTPVRVSQHGVETAIASYAVVDDARAFGYTYKGHIFYVLTFPTEGHTWVYDATTREWHERASYGLTRWRPCATAFAYNRNYVQDFETGQIGYIDANTYTEFGATQPMQWTYPPVYDRGNLKFHSELSVRVETGVGLATGQGSDPQIMLEVSDDGGRTWDFVETLSFGVQGNYQETVVWNQLGMTDERLYRNTVSDPVPVTITDAQLLVS